WRFSGSLFLVCGQTRARRPERIFCTSLHFPVPLCPTGWSEYGNRCFLFQSTETDWATAEVHYCRQHHTDLASVRSMSENEQMKGLVQSAGEIQAWIGLYRNSWMWVDGSNSSFRHWRASEPNGSEENCATAVHADAGQWEDWPCSWKMPFFCNAGKP
uniref:C-type lectin domain-containing protein n=1 Tax=Xiphophorus couchianus TaxID=32473 RepID=A0A3B5MDH6_9TELE